MPDRVGPEELRRVRLRVGDQKGNSQSLLRSAGLDRAPYAIEWSTFTSGPPLLEAVSADAVDAGGVGNTPPLFAAAAKRDVKAISVSRGNVTSDALVVRKDSAAKDYERVMPSGLLFRNALGGMVATTVYNASMHVWEQVYEARQDYLAYVLGRLGGADAEYQLMNAQPAQLVARRGDGFDLLTVFNYSYDAMENATLRCARTPRSVERLDDHGTWRAAKFTPVAGGCIVVDGEVASCGVAAYRVKN